MYWFKFLIETRKVNSNQQKKTDHKVGFGY
jgi:hypothetical protein